MSGIDRTQVVRIDCTTCKGNGYVRNGAAESMCEKCGGGGVLEREVPYKFETHGVLTDEEKAEIFEMPVDQIEDKGHDIEKDERDRKSPNEEE